MAILDPLCFKMSDNALIKCNGHDCERQLSYHRIGSRCNFLEQSSCDATRQPTIEPIISDAVCTGCGATRQIPDSKLMPLLFMMYWHKVQMICSGHFVAPSVYSQPIIASVVDMVFISCSQSKSVLLLMLASTLITAQK